MKLYEIDAAIENFEFDVDENGEVSNFADLDALQMARDVKVENVACCVKNLSAFVSALEAEKDSIERKIRIAKNRIDGYKRFLDYALDGKRFETPRCKVGFRTSERVEIVDEMAFGNYANTYDKSLLRVVTKVEPDKTAIKRLLKDGVKVDGAVLVKSKNIQVG